MYSAWYSEGINSRNAIALVKTTRKINTTASTIVQRLTFKSHFWKKDSTRGAITRTPAISPIHQVNQISWYALAGMTCPMNMLVTPTVAEKTVLSTAPNATNKNALLTRSKHREPFAY